MIKRKKRTVTTAEIVTFFLALVVLFTIIIIMKIYIMHIHDTPSLHLSNLIVYYS